MSQPSPSTAGKSQSALSGLKTRLGIVGELFVFLWAAKCGG